MYDFVIKDHAKNAIFYGGKVYSYAQLLQYSSLFAAYYSSQVERVERVMYVSTNTPEYMIAILAAFRLDATAIPVDVTSTKKELGYMINDARPQIIYSEAESVEKVRECVEEISKRENEAGLGSYTPHIFTPEMVDVSGAESVTIEPIAVPNLESVMTIIYTSGTTGSPKGVMLTYSNLWYNIDAVSNQVKIFNINSRTLMLLPLHHIFTFAGSFLAPLYSGGEIHIVESLTPEAIIGTLQSGRITHLIGVPRLYETLAKGIMAKINASIVTRAIYKVCSWIGSDSLSKKIFKSVHDKFGGAMEFVVSGGAALPTETATIFKNLGFYILEGYGMTECAPMISFTRPGERKIGYSGRMLPGCEYMIAEHEELCVRGANVMKGYYKREEETAAVIRDGWLHTGDTAIYDEKFGVKITGRIKEIIVTPNGKNINPAEIENEITQSSTAIKEIAILLHEDILQAIVDPDLAAVHAETQQTMDEMVRAEIEGYNREAMGYKRIMRYQIISQELPKTRLGKIQRFKLLPLMEQRDETPKEDISDRSETFKLLKEFIDDQTGSYANPDSHFEIDLALDSLGRISLISFIEDSFGVAVTETQLSELSTLNLLSEYVESNSDETNLSTGEVSWSDILTSNENVDIKLPHSGFVHWFTHGFIWLLFALFYRFRASGEKSIPEGATLFIANHRSGLDGVFVSTPLKWGAVHRTLFFAKDKHFQGGFKRFMARRNNIILMNIHTNVRESMQQMYHVLSSGHNIVIFPEGTRSKSGELGAFKESFAILSQSLNIPVVPVVIRGSEGATYNSIRIPRLWQRISAEYLSAMLPEEGESTQEFTARVRARFEDALKK